MPAGRYVYSRNQPTLLSHYGCPAELSISPSGMIEPPKLEAWFYLEISSII